MITKRQASRIRLQYAHFRLWLGKRRSYRLEDVPKGLRPPTNDQLTQLEVFEWMTKPPERYFAYYQNAAGVQTLITTWTGAALGHVTHAGPVFVSNMGDRRRAIHVRGNNGVSYVGTAFLTSGDYCRLRRAK